MAKNIKPLFIRFSSLILRNPPLHLFNHHHQFCFAFFAGVGIDILGNVLAMCISGGVFALPEVVVLLADIAGAGFSVFGLGRLEGAGLNAGFFFLRGHGCVGFSDLTVDFHRRLLLHQIGDVGVNVQRGCRRNVPDDRR